MRAYKRIREHQYVRVTGGLKSFGKKRYINATHIREVKDSHEIYFHILEAIAVTLILERGPVRVLYYHRIRGLLTSE